MMGNLGTHGRVGIVLLAVAAAAIAGAAWRLVIDNPPTLSAHAIVEKACSRMETVDSFDVRSTLTVSNVGSTTPDRTARYDVRVSGGDFHMVATLQEFNTVQTIEFFGVSGTVYAHEVGSDEWEVSDEFQLGDLHPTIPGVDALCPELGHTVRVGEEMLDSTPVEHFRSTASQDIGPVGNVDDPSSSSSPMAFEFVQDLWVDSTGQLTQTKLVQTVAVDGEKGRAEMLSVISGVGEPNVITAPDIAGRKSSSSPSATTTPAETPGAAADSNE